MYLYSFEKLEVWKENIRLVKNIYKFTKEFPENEKFGLISQMRRASISIASNISEGTSRMTNTYKETRLIINKIANMLNALRKAQLYQKQ